MSLALCGWRLALLNLASVSKLEDVFVSQDNCGHGMEPVQRFRKHIVLRFNAAKCTHRPWVRGSEIAAELPPRLCSAVSGMSSSRAPDILGPRNFKVKPIRRSVVPSRVDISVEDVHAMAARARRVKAGSMLELAVAQLFHGESYRVAGASATDRAAMEKFAAEGVGVIEGDCLIEQREIVHRLRRPGAQADFFVPPQ
jgi:hypothetical protein